MRAITLCMALLLAGCSPGYEESKGHELALPPELSDCKIYKVSDGLRTLYITRCSRGTTTSWTEACGKGCVRYEDSSLVEVQK